MYKLITSAKVSDDLSIGCDRSRDRRKQELNNNKNIKGKNRFRIMLKGVVGFAEHREKTAYGLGYKLTQTRNKDDAVIDKVAGIADARVRIDHIYWYIFHFTPSIHQQGILFKQISSKTPTELRHIERSVFTKGVNNQNHRTFQVGSQENMNVPIWVIIGFQQRDRKHSTNLINGTFCRSPVVFAQLRYWDGKISLCWHIFKL